MKLVRATEEIDTHYEKTNGRVWMPIYEIMAKDREMFIVLDEFNDILGDSYYNDDRSKMYILLSETGRIYVQNYYWFKEI